MNKTKPLVIAVVGPTASGKTDLARRLALQHNGELVSADSRQVYRFLDIGTGKDGTMKPNSTGSTLAQTYPELRYLDTVPQWLTDFVDPFSTRYTVAEYQKAAYAVIDDILSRGKTPILVGGTGLYVSSVLEGYDFSFDTTRDSTNPRHSDKQSYQKQPPPWRKVEIGISVDRDALDQRIRARLKQRIKDGLIEEARGLYSQGLSLETMRSFGLEYRYLADLLEEKLMSPDLFEEQLASAIRRYAKRQVLWFRKHGSVVWVDSDEEADRLIASSLNHDDAS